MKFPFTFSLKFVFRLILPGLIISIGAFPLAEALLGVLGISIPPEFPFIFLVGFFGWFFVIGDNHIYMLIEGRRYWPKFLVVFFQTCEKDRLSKLIAQRANCKSTNRGKYREACFELRRFPLDDAGRYYVSRPTRLGNLLESYETYSSRNYGMDSVFYWPRIWLVLDEDLRERIDSQQSIADSAAYTTIALFFFGVLSMYYSFHLNNTFIKYLPDKPSLLVIISILSFFLSYAVYRLSIHTHAEFGETFKAVFDVYRNSLSVDDIIDDLESIIGDNNYLGLSSIEKRKICFRYLQYYKIRKNEENIPIPDFITKKTKNIAS